MDGAPAGAGRPALTATLLVLGAGPAQLGALRAARLLGVSTLVCDQDPDAFCIRHLLHDDFAEISTMDVDGIARLARERRVDGIIAPGTDQPVLVAARLAQELGLPHPIDPATAARATDKRLQRTALDAAGVPQPAWSSGADVEDGSLVGNLVVKAADTQGQRGLSVVTGPELLESALSRARAAGRSGGTLVEQLIDGPEVTVNAISIGGRFVPLTVTDRERRSAFGVATAHLYPSTRPADLVAEATAVAEQACEAIGLRHGPSYTQIVLGSAGPRVMEVAARLGGGHDAELCQAALGIDLAAAAVLAALGQPLTAPTRKCDRAAVVRFLVAEPGTVRRVGGLEEARSVPGVLDAHSYRKPGDEIAPLAVGSDRAGFVLAAGESRREAEDAANQAAALVRFER